MTEGKAKDLLLTNQCIPVSVVIKFLGVMKNSQLCHDYVNQIQCKVKLLVLG